MLKHNRIIMSAVGFAFCLLPLNLSYAGGGETGLSHLHDLVEMKGKTCMKTHYHYGFSLRGKTEKEAMKEAIESYSAFTSLEYGADWKSFELAESKGKKCKAEGEKSVRCEVSARPCKKVEKAHKAAKK